MPIKFYLAEDNYDHAELIEDMLQESRIKYTLFHFPNGLELIKGLPKKPDKHDVILLDIKMPKLNGLDTLKKIRNNSEYKKTIILILTTSTISTDMNTAANLGADGFMSKPLTFDDLKPYLKELLSYEHPSY